MQNLLKTILQIQANGFELVPDPRKSIAEIRQQQYQARMAAETTTASGSSSSAAGPAAIAEITDILGQMLQILANQEALAQRTLAVLAEIAITLDDRGPPPPPPGQPSADSEDPPPPPWMQWALGCHIVSGLSHIVSMRQCQYWTHLYSNTGAHTHTSPLTTIPPTGYGPQRTTARIQQSSTHAQLHIWFEIGWHLRHQCRVYIIQLYSETPTREKHL